MIYQNIYKEIVSSFGELWKVKDRGNSLEIITPFATTSQKFVSLFLTEKEKEYIISDGGWITEGLYDNTFNRGIDCFEKIFLYYINTFNIKEAKKQSGANVFYKKTDKAMAVPSLLFDMANFVSTIVSLTNVEYSDKELETEHNFTKSAKTYLLNLKPKRTWDEWIFNDYLDQKREVRPSAILRKKNSKLIVFNFITGSNYNYFRTNIGKTMMVFSLADDSKESIYIQGKVALLDNKARGYQPDHWSIWLKQLLEKTNSIKIDWTKRREVQKY